MKLNELPKSITRNKKRLGRGYGSGKGGHTSSRGAKGDKARGKNKLLFEGVKTKKSLIKRLPFLRGKDKLRPGMLVQTVSLRQLKSYKTGETVNAATLHEKHLINRPNLPVKLLSDGEISVALSVGIPCSKQTKEKIIKAGGKMIDPIDSQPIQK